jgi:hypothetical protein
MPRARLSLPPVLLALILALFSSVALAHGPQVDVSGLEVVVTPEGSFLHMLVDPPDANDQLRLLAIAAPSGTAQFERWAGKDYQQVESIAVSHESGRLDAGTPYRIRLAAPPVAGDPVPLTILFSGGTVLREEAPITRSQVASRSLLIGTLVGTVVAVLVAAAITVALSMGRGRRGTEQ